jgi:hypothetical protein
MTKQRSKPTHPGLVVLRRSTEGHWELLGEFTRVRGLTAQAARTAAVMQATKGQAKPGEIYVAILRSEWRIALDWEPRPSRLAVELRKRSPHRLREIH